MEKIYISGPITGTNDYMERFAKAEEYLQSMGYTVINPAMVNDQLPEDTTWKQYMEMSIVMLKMCGAIYMLDGWEKSKGACIEYGYALAKDLIVLEEGTWEKDI